VGGARGAETYILIANTSESAGQARVTLLFDDETSASKVVHLAARSRTNIPVGFAESAGGFGAVAAGRRFGALVESLGPSPVQIAVERAMYTSTGALTWSAGTNAVATRLTP
jgi:hypothetical protein